MHQGRTINFGGPFARLDVMSELRRRTGLALPLEDHDALREHSLDAIQRHSIVLGSDHAPLHHLIDKLIGHFIEPHCVQPTFLMNHPLVCSPLAKSVDGGANRHYAERFELFINGMEVANAYSEQNDPAAQQAAFAQKAGEPLSPAGMDGEVPVADEDFVRILNVGMPPTAGLGIGVDRLVMLLTDQHHMRNVLLFPLVKDPR